MAKKRGGLAGIWDRNKKIIKPIAAGLAGLVGTPALGAAVGAAMGGLDRPGKSGIGLDVGDALKGGVSGYAAGTVGNALPGIATAGKAGYASGGLMGGAKAAGAAALPAVVKASGAAGLPGLGTIGGGTGGGDGSGGGSIDPWMKALAAAQLANAGVLGAKSGDYASRAMGDTQAWWNQREPLRKQGIAGMQAPPTTLPQLGKIAAAGNPFAPKG
jgi:hypothetical protein